MEPKLHSVKLDPGQFEQVLVNLVVNARDAMPNGGGLTIQTANVNRAESTVLQELESSIEEFAMVSVTDNGLGIADHIKARLFEPFFTTKDKGIGTGLGLATCHDIVKQYGGHIEVRTEHGWGTTFEVYLPRTLEEVPTVVTEHIEEIPTVVTEHIEEVPHGWETVLIAEDEDMVRELLARTLKDQGYTVLEAADGIEALHIIQADDQGIQLLLSDVEMPRMGGIELAYRVKSVKPETQVLLISGLSEDAITMYDTPNSATCFMEKPFPPEVLASKVRELLDN